jgi:hypothetical protein
MTDKSKDLIIRILTPDGGLCGEHTVSPGCNLDLDGDHAHAIMVLVVDSLRLGQKALDVRAKLTAQDKADKLALGEVTPEPVPEPTRFVVCHAGYNYKVGSKVHKALRHTMSASCGAWPVGVLGDDTQEVRDRFPASMKCKKCWPVDQCRQDEVKS